MAKKFGFFNSIQGDRKYLASDISQAFDIGITTGIKAEEDNLKVVPYEGMQVQIQPGSAMIFGHFYTNDDTEIITLDTADPELNRIDRVVVRYDAYTREVNTAVIKGSPALSPTPPSRLETPEQFDLVLADIYVPAAATVVNETNITDMRYSELCGFIGVKGAVTQEEFDGHVGKTSADDVHGLKPVVLFYGNVSATNTIITLSETLANFERLDIRISMVGQEYRTWYLKQSNYVDLRAINIVNDETDTSLEVAELRLQQNTTTSLKIIHNLLWRWSGNQNANAQKFSDHAGALQIYTILGYR